MNPQRPGRTRRSLVRGLTKIALVGVYLAAVLGVSGLTMTAGTSPAEAKKSSKSSRGNNRGRRGRRGRRGGNCTIALQLLDLC